MSFVDRVKGALTEYGVNAGQLSEERVSAILNDFYQKIDWQLSRMEISIPGALAVNVIQERIETCMGYQLHFYKGCGFHRIGESQDAEYMTYGDSGG
jgi:hypothetical protein